jgi:hypothetical protein
MGTKPFSLVLLNLFQHPFHRQRRSLKSKNLLAERDTANLRRIQGTGHAARWVLKQVQHDQVREWEAICDSPAVPGRDRARQFAAGGRPPAMMNVLREEHGVTV